MKQYSNGFLLRPLLLLEHGKELAIIVAMGSLLLISIVMAAFARFQGGRRIVALDAFLGLALFFSLVPLMYDTPKSRLLFVAERCQWLALVALVIWLVAIVDAHRGAPTRVIVLAAFLSLPLQAVRLVRSEETLSHLRPEYDLAIAVTDHLAEGSLVVPVVTEPNWLLQHLGAFIAMQHNGLLLTRKDQLIIMDPVVGQDTTCRLCITPDPSWLPDHWRRGGRPVVDHILLLGHDPDRDDMQNNWNEMTDHNYCQVFDNGYARVYTAIPQNEE